MLKAAQMSNLPTLIYKFHVILFKIPAGLFEGLDKFVLKYIEAIMSTIAEFILEREPRVEAGGGRLLPLGLEVSREDNESALRHFVTN